MKLIKNLFPHLILHYDKVFLLCKLISRAYSLSFTFNNMNNQKALINNPLALKSISTERSMLVVG